MNMLERMEKGVVVLQPLQRIDASVCPEFSCRLSKAVHEGSGKVLLDLSQAVFISSSTLSVLMAAQKQSLAEGGVLALCAPNQAVKDLLSVVHLENSFSIYDNYREALEALHD
ncbi:MAG: STAS domain-containing protein [Candidatus Omnitrophota bacterium]